jgi:hypothetical protein
MLTHIVIFNWMPEVTGEQVAAFGLAFDRLAASLQDLAVFRHGPDLAIRQGNGDYALVATFADRAEWDAYQAHPEHQAFVRDFVTPIQASRLTIQF